MAAASHPTIVGFLPTVRIKRPAFAVAAYDLEAAARATELLGLGVMRRAEAAEIAYAVERARRSGVRPRHDVVGEGRATRAACDGAAVAVHLQTLLAESLPERGLVEGIARHPERSGKRKPRRGWFRAGTILELKETLYSGCSHFSKPKM